MCIDEFPLNVGCLVVAMQNASGLEELNDDLQTLPSHFINIYELHNLLLLSVFFVSEDSEDSTVSLF